MKRMVKTLILLFVVFKTTINFSQDCISVDLDLSYLNMETYKANKVSLGIINFGYIFNINDLINTTPTIGYVYNREIYQDPIGWDTYYCGKPSGMMNLGINATFKKDWRRISHKIYHKKVSDEFSFHAVLFKKNKKCVLLIETNVQPPISDEKKSDSTNT